MNDRLILSPPPADSILLQDGTTVENKIKSLEANINALNNSINTLNNNLSSLKNSLGNAAYLNTFSDWNHAGQSKGGITKDRYEIPVIALNDGVMEVGQYIDMHTKGLNNDYDRRFNSAA